MTNKKFSANVSINCSATGNSKKTNEFGMRPMQERAFEKRGEKYLLIKSPPASGKSRALMFIALDKVMEQGLQQGIIAVPEKTIGASFNNEPLKDFGFFENWEIKPRWNLCNAPGEDGSKVNAVKNFLQSEDKFLICTHATLRFALDQLGIEAFDNRILAIDEFHHSSTDPDNVLGSYVTQIIERDKTHIIAMTGSYFRGDSEPVLSPTDEEKFQTVTYTYYEQLNGYEFLKSLTLAYSFYTGSYLDFIGEVINEDEKTIIHIPHVGSREASPDKYKAVDGIIDKLGEWKLTDEETGFYLVKTKKGKLLKVADLVNDDPAHRTKVIDALKDPKEKDNKKHIDIIIALGMAKEGFDWIWCEHALTVGYRSSLTEIVQIIGRATRDAPDKTKAKFTNLIAEPDATQDLVVDAVNDTLKAISASLLMEQVLVPKFNFTPKYTPPTGSDEKYPSKHEKISGPLDGFDYGKFGYTPGQTNIGFCESRGEMHIEIENLAMPKSEKAKQIVDKDLDSIVVATLQDPQALRTGTLDENAPPQQVTIEAVGKIVKTKYPELDEEDSEAIRQHAVAKMAVVQQAGKIIRENQQMASENNALVAGIRKYSLDVRNLDVDLIDSINPFGEAFEILGKSLNPETLAQMMKLISGSKTTFTEEEAMALGRRAVIFFNEKNKAPSLTAHDPWEKRMAEAVAWLERKEALEKNE